MLHLACYSSAPQFPFLQAISEAISSSSLVQQKSSWTIALRLKNIPTQTVFSVRVFLLERFLISTNTHRRKR